jgi:hypothetical protein
MEQVAAMFGKKLGEQFYMKINRNIYTVKLTRQGLKALTNYNAWESINLHLSKLLTGKAVIVDD